MTTLLQRCQTLDSKLKSLALAKRHADDQILIQQRTQEWKDRHEKLTAIRSRTTCLNLSPDASQVVATKREALRQNAGKVLARLREHDDIKELTRDAAWKRLLKASEGLTDALEVSGSSAWRVYVEQQGTLEDPATVRLRTPPTPQNDEALRAYQQSHAAYAAIARLALPRTQEDLTQLTGHIADCREAFAQLTFDLPQDVKRFYEAIHAGTATLAHVTPAVLAWLADHRHLERFSIRSTSR